MSANLASGIKWQHVFFRARAANQGTLNSTAPPHASVRAHVECGLSPCPGICMRRLLMRSITSLLYVCMLVCKYVPCICVARH